MARFLKQSFAQTCLKETDSSKLQQFNYSRSLITNRGTVERGIGRIAKNYSAPPGRERGVNLLCKSFGILFGSCTGTNTLSTSHYDHCDSLMGVSLLENKAELQLVDIAIWIGQFQSDRAF